MRAKRSNPQGAIALNGGDCFVTSFLAMTHSERLLHDFTDYLDEMEEVDLETGLPGHTPESLRIRLDKVLMQQLRDRS